MKLYFEDTSFDGQLQRSVGKADSGMASVGECLAIAEQITPGDRDSWYEAWSAFAGRLVAQADEAAKGGHLVSARGASLRAVEYFRQAFFFHREDLGADQLGRPTRRAFEPSAPRSTTSSTPVRSSLDRRRAITSARAVRLDRARPSSTSAATTARPRSCSRRPPPHSIADSPSPPWTAPGRGRCCATSECRCARTGRMSSRRCSTR
jgi:hypothetical protein